MKKNIYEPYEMVIGLEVHAELKTHSKIYCGCSTAFGALPNTQCCPVCMGFPGTLPVLNEAVVSLAVKAGLATNCRISNYAKQDRKNYFYPDLPKAYQISQYDLPLCEAGYLQIETEAGEKKIGITRIHIEEDAGKLLHTTDGYTLVDYNRCGVPLIEIVSEPDLRSAKEAEAYLRKLRAILIYCNVSDGKMQEGSFRCDVNLSVRKKDTEMLGTRTEMKNLNSFQSVSRAISYEFMRQVDLLEAGEKIIQETRRFDQNTGKTLSMRSKENADDYRYFPDPDLLPIVLTESKINEIKSSIPVLPDARKMRYIEQYGLPSADAEIIVSEKEIADFFETAAALTTAPRILANLLLGEVFRLLPTEETKIPLAPARLATLSDLLAENKINYNTAKQVLNALWKKDMDPLSFIAAQDLWQITDYVYLQEIAESIIAANPKIVQDYLGGKTNAFQSLMGRAMGMTGGKADPTLLQEALQNALTK
ncbi:MAG: Asp-tRNA(Asn)/Glu-tRNA(Gln) amidotransferase subunit GatB [Christensenellaceae bacterium]|jgi:aspartyl-tRNA(Asn)/glutamyl-tRNA(Gln) amidotransferase subunit B